MESATCFNNLEVGAVVIEVESESSRIISPPGAVLFVEFCKEVRSLSIPSTVDTRALI